jgi:metallo-beta-lactamase class B
MKHTLGAALLVSLTLAGASGTDAAETADLLTQAIQFGAAAEWNRPQDPVRIYGQTYYVGVPGLSSVLIHTDAGSILLDGDLPQSAPLIEANIRKLGFRVEDIKLILNSHAHFDHAGGIAALQRDSGAEALASPSGAKALREGHVADDDPQSGDIRCGAFPRRSQSARSTRRPNLALGQCRGHRAFHARTYAGKHDLDLARLREFALPRRGVRRQPEPGIGSRLSFSRR